MNLRKEARGRDCMVRLPGICNGDPATTVLAHLRLSGISGMGIKAPDALAVPACYACHSYVDTHHDDATKVAFYESIFRWQSHLISNGDISWK